MREGDHWFGQVAGWRAEIWQRWESIRNQESIVVILGIALLAAATLTCAGLLVPIAWTAAIESASASRPTYQRCGALPDDASRLSCYDAVFCATVLISRKDSLRVSAGTFQVAELQERTYSSDLVWHRCRLRPTP